MTDTITISWHIDNVKSLDDSLTDDQCREALQILKKSHDAEIGINWHTIQAAIDMIK